jgi:tetratricopeptide (TPR) repeat protein
MLERNFAEAARILENSPREELDYMNGGATPKSFLLGLTALARGEKAKAEEEFASAAANFEKQVRQSPEVAVRHANLGLCYSFMGRREEAIREGRRAVELKPEAIDAFDGVLMQCYLALIYARAGENFLAFTLLERLAVTPGAVDSVDHSVTANDLKLRWEWDVIRNDPRFAPLVAEME